MIRILWLNLTKEMKKINNKFLEKLPLKNIQRMEQVRGGDVNKAFKVMANGENYFLLVQPHATKDFFTPEAAGLRDFKRAGVTAPEVIDWGDIGSDAYLLITYLEEGYLHNYSELAKMIAHLHHYPSQNGLFGYDYPHHGAKMTFDNTWTDSWTELFVERRLDRLRDELIQLGYWSDAEVSQYEKARLIMIYELDTHRSQPVLLHGDLWGGNHMFLKNGQPAIFDPSPLYGDREFDLGVATSFGVYPTEFFESYHREFPLESGVELRLAFYRLYVYMNHLHKFGRIYENPVNQTLNEIIYY